jgi:hypothetical protein
VSLLFAYFRMKHFSKHRTCFIIPNTVNTLLIDFHWFYAPWCYCIFFILTFRKFLKTSRRLDWKLIPMYKTVFIIPKNRQPWDYTAFFVLFLWLLVLWRFSKRGKLQARIALRVAIFLHLIVQMIHVISYVTCCWVGVLKFSKDCIAFTDQELQE